jgi:hypothetical protein
VRPVAHLGRVPRDLVWWSRGEIDAINRYTDRRNRNRGVDVERYQCCPRDQSVLAWVSNDDRRFYSLYVCHEIEQQCQRNDYQARPTYECRPFSVFHRAPPRHSRACTIATGGCRHGANLRAAITALQSRRRQFRPQRAMARCRPRCACAYPIVSSLRVG